MLKRWRWVCVALAPLAVSGCGRTIDSGHRGVYYNWRTGTDISRVLPEGFHLVAPWNKVISYDIRTKDRVEKLNLLSKDQLQIQGDVSIRFNLVPQRVGQLHAKIGPDFYRMVIQPVLRNTTRDVLSRYESIEAYRNRAEIEREIQAKIKPAFARYDYFAVDRVMLRRMDFPEVVVQAIERKLAMKQEAARETFKLEKAKIAAQRKIVEAEATAKAQAILKSQLNETLLRWKGIEATLALAESNNTKIVVVGAGKSGLPLILGDAK